MDTRLNVINFPPQALPLWATLVSEWEEPKRESDASGGQKHMSEEMINEMKHTGDVTLRLICPENTVYCLN